MKTIEIEETETQLVIKPQGSKVARIVSKSDGGGIRDALLEVMAEMPEEKPKDREPDETLPPAADLGDESVQEAVGGLLRTAGELLASPEAQRIRGLLERLPKPKKKGAASGG